MDLITNDIYQSHQQQVRTIYSRISLLNKNNLKVGEITGKIISGTYNCNSESAVRNTCDLAIIVDDESLIPAVGSMTWIGTRFRLEVGIMNLITNGIDYINRGIFLIDAPSLKYSLTTKELDIKGLDLMCLLDGTRGGYLQAKIEIQIGTNISVAIMQTIIQLGGVKDVDVNVEQTGYTVPYLITKDVGSTVYDVLKELCGLYSNFEMFFDENGVFVFQTIKNRNTDAVSYDFSVDKDIIIDIQYDIDYQNIKNHINVWGKLNSDGTQPHSEGIITDLNNPFNTINLGDIYFSIQDDKIQTQDQADIRKKYELWKHSLFNQKITINCLAIYYLYANQVIYVDKPEVKITDKFLIQTLSTDLKTGTMQITGYILSYFNEIM